MDQSNNLNLNLFLSDFKARIKLIAKITIFVEIVSLRMYLQSLRTVLSRVFKIKIKRIIRLHICQSIRINLRLNFI